jgi:hypothetical protein
LAERLTLHDVDDAAAFVAAVINRSGLRLSWADREDLQQYLLGEIWRLSLVYQRGNPRFPPMFSVYATRLLSLRTVDWIRSRNGRTKWKFADSVYERQRPQLVSLDDSARDRLEQSQPEGDGDREAGGDLGIPGLYAGGDRQRTRDFRILGLESDGRAA